MRGIFIGMIFGVLLFFGSFFLLFFNEGRENLGEVAEEAVEYDPEASYTEEDLVYITGSIHTESPVTDDYLLDNDYVYIERSVEMYAYIEVKKDDNDDTYYEYELDWTTSPQKPHTFDGRNRDIPDDIPEDYSRWIDEMPDTTGYMASDLSIDNILLSRQDLEVSNPRDLMLSETLVDEDALREDESVENEFMFRQNTYTGSVHSPSLGDVRITYAVVSEEDSGILLTGVAEDGTFAGFRTP